MALMNGLEELQNICHDPAAKAILADIRDEEKVHVGELITLMRYLDPHEAECFLEGEAEVHEMLEKLGLKGQSEGIAPAEGPTVGSLVKKGDRAYGLSGKRRRSHLCSAVAEDR